MYYDTKEVHSQYIQTENGLKEFGIVVGINHPCYSKVVEIIEEYNRKNEIHAGDICKFGTDEEVDIYVTMNMNKNMDNAFYVEGFYLNGSKKGQIDSFYTKELRKTDRHMDIDEILKQSTRINMQEEHIISEDFVEECKKVKEKYPLKEMEEVTDEYSNDDESN